MRSLFGFFVFISCFQILFAQSRLESSVYAWNPQGAIFNGSGAVLTDQQLQGHTIRGGRRMIFQTLSSGTEMFFIIKHGPVDVSLNGQTRRLDKGSVVFVMPGDAVALRNPRKDEAAIYEMQMHAARRDETAGRAAGPSFMMDWYDMIFRAHDKGGVRQLFDRKTVTMKRFDIHITQLNPGLSSHAPHTHQNEEIILMIDGEGEMILGTTPRRIITGQAAWVASMLPHNITNIGKRPALYFAIQWN